MQRGCSDAEPGCSHPEGRTLLLPVPPDSRSELSTGVTGQACHNTGLFSHHIVKQGIQAGIKAFQSEAISDNIKFIKK